MSRTTSSPDGGQAQGLACANPFDPNSPAGVCIIGAGVIGLCTAYYLAKDLHDKETGTTKVPILVVDTASKVASAASGQNAGMIHDFGYQNDVLAELAEFSFEQHEKLAAELDGMNTYGLTPATVYRTTSSAFEGETYPPKNWSPGPESEIQSTALPSWVKVKDWKTQIIGQGGNSARLDPAAFCETLYSACQRLGVKFMFKSRVFSLTPDLRRDQFAYVTIGREDFQTPSFPFRCTSVVLAAGPWSNQVISDIFPVSRFMINMPHGPAGQNWVRIGMSAPQMNGGPPRRRFCHQVYANCLAERSESRFSLVSSGNGEIYLSGIEAAWAPLPRDSERIATQIPEVDKLLQAARRVLNVDDDEEIELHSAGRCYSARGGEVDCPIVIKVPMTWLWAHPEDTEMSRRARAEMPRGVLEGGFFINTAHGDNGMSLAPGCGAIMSQLLRGETPEIDLSALPSAIVELDLSHDVPW